MLKHGKSTPQSGSWPGLTSDHHLTITFSFCCSQCERRCWCQGKCVIMTVKGIQREAGEKASGKSYSQPSPNMCVLQISSLMLTPHGVLKSTDPSPSQYLCDGGVFGEGVRSQRLGLMTRKQMTFLHPGLFRRRAWISMLSPQHPAPLGAVFGPLGCGKILNAPGHPWPLSYGHRKLHVFVCDGDKRTEGTEGPCFVILQAGRCCKWQFL